MRRKNSSGGVNIFETMLEVLKLHLESGSDGSETSLIRKKDQHHHGNGLEKDNQSG